MYLICNSIASIIRRNWTYSLTSLLSRITSTSTNFHGWLMHLIQEKWNTFPRKIDKIPGDKWDPFFTLSRSRCPYDDFQSRVMLCEDQKKDFQKWRITSSWWLECTPVHKTRKSFLLWAAVLNTSSTTLEKPCTKIVQPSEIKSWPSMAIIFRAWHKKD